MILNVFKERWVEVDEVIEHWNIEMRRSHGGMKY